MISRHDEALREGMRAYLRDRAQGFATLTCCDCRHSGQVSMLKVQLGRGQFRCTGCGGSRADVRWARQQVEAE